MSIEQKITQSDYDKIVRALPSPGEWMPPIYIVPYIRSTETFRFTFIKEPVGISGVGVFECWKIEEVEVRTNY